MSTWYRVQRGVLLLNFDRQFAALVPAITQVSQAQVSVADRQRDIFESHRHRVFALSYYMTGHEVEAEEILTGTFIRAFQTVEEPNGQIVDSALVTELKTRFPLGKMEPAAVADTESSLGGRNVCRNDLEDAVRTLPATERMLFLLRDVEGYTPEAIAKLLELDVPQVNRVLLSARIRLRTALAAMQTDHAEAA